MKIKDHHFEKSKLFEKLVAFFHGYRFFYAAKSFVFIRMYIVIVALRSLHNLCRTVLATAMTIRGSTRYFAEQCEQNENEIEPNINMNDRERKIHSD